LIPWIFHLAPRLDAWTEESEAAFDRQTAAILAAGKRALQIVRPL